MKRVLIAFYVFSSILGCTSWLAGMGQENVKAAGAWVTSNIPKGSAIGSNRLPSADFPWFKYLDYKLVYEEPHTVGVVTYNTRTFETIGSKFWLEAKTPWLILLSDHDMPTAPNGYRLMFYRDRPWYSYSNWPFPCHDFTSITQEYEVSIWRKG